MWEKFAGSRAYIDTNILILAVEGGNRREQVLRSLFKAIDEGAIQASTSELTLAEVLAKPIAAKAEELIATHESILAPGSPIDTYPVSRGVLRSAAGLQGRSGIKLHDAIHVATAREAGCQHFISNDARLGRKLASGIAWLPLAQLEE